MNIIKLLLIILFLDFIGYSINELFLKFKKPLYVLYGFIFLIGVVQIYSVPLIYFHVNIIFSEIIFIGIISILIVFSIKKKGIVKYKLLNRIKTTPKIYFILLVILGLILSTLSSTTIDQWLYSSLTISSLGDEIYKNYGPWYSQGISGHSLNSYYLFNAMFIDIFHVNPLDYIFGIYRFIDALVLLQLFVLFSTIFKKRREFAVTLMILGILGASFWSNSPHGFSETAMLLNGMNGTLLYETVYPILLIMYVWTKNEKYLYLLIPFSFAVTTTIYIINILVLIILKFMRYQISNKILILIGYFYIVHIGAILIFRDFYIIAIVFSIFVCISLFLFTKISGKIMMALLILILVLFNFITKTAENLLLYNDMVTGLTVTALLIILSIVLIYSARKTIDKNIIKFSCIVLLLWALIPHTLSWEDSIKFDVVQYRFFYLMCFQIYSIQYILFLNKKVIYILIICSSLIVSELLIIGKDDHLLSLIEAVQYKKDGKEKYFLDDNISQINEILKESGYPDVELYFQINLPTSSPSELPNMSYIPSLIPNVVVKFYDSPSRDFCNEEDVLCYKVYPRGEYFITEDQYEYLLEDFYVVKYEEEI